MCGLGCISRDAWLRQTHIVHATYGRPTPWRRSYPIFCASPPTRRRCLQQRQQARCQQMQPTHPANGLAHIIHPSNTPRCRKPSRQRIRTPALDDTSGIRGLDETSTLDTSPFTLTLSTLHSHAHTTRNTHELPTPLSPSLSLSLSPPHSTTLVPRRNDVSHHARADQEEV